MRQNLPFGRFVVALVIALLAFPVPAFAQDLRTPDTREGTSDAATVTVTQDDLRTPDARDVTPAAATVGQGDLRTPDARDAATVAYTPTDVRSPDSRDVTEGPVTSTPTVVVTPEADEFDWGDAAIGAGVTLAVLMLLGGATYLSRRRGPAKPVPTTPVPVAGHERRVRPRPPTRARGRTPTR